MIDWLGALARDGGALGDAASAAGLGAAVAACPGWTVADLVYHVGEVHSFWRTIVAERRSTPDGLAEPPRPADDALLGWYREGIDATVRVLRDADPAGAVWTWAPQQDVAFVRRRMAQETAVHRWDAEHAAGRDHAIDAPIAAGGIDEFLEFFVGRARRDADPVGGSVHLHCTDTDGEWVVRPSGDGRTFGVTREHAKGDAALRGAASDLLLLLWRRVPLDTVDVIGDAAVAARLVAHTNLD